MSTPQHFVAPNIGIFEKKCWGQLLGATDFLKKCWGQMLGAIIGGNIHFEEMLGATVGDKRLFVKFFKFLKEFSPPQAEKKF